MTCECPNIEGVKQHSMLCPEHTIAGCAACQDLNYGAEYRARHFRPAVMPLVVIESPFAGKSDWIWPFNILGRWLSRRANVRYARACMRDAILRGEAPIASHLLYTQPGILDDDDPAQRARGIRAGFAWGTRAMKRAVYMDRGISSGMSQGREQADEIGQAVEYRTLGGRWQK